MKVIKLTRGRVALVDDEDYNELSKYTWHAIKGNSTWYATRSVYLGGGRKNRKTTSIIMHRQIMGASGHLDVVDHADHDGLNNQKSNLRKTNHSGNNRNKSSEKNSTSKYLGVDFDKSRNKWKSRIRFNGKELYLGRFDSEIDAAKAYDEAAKKYHKEFANPNFK